MIGHIAWSGAEPARLVEREERPPRYFSWLGAPHLRAMGIVSALVLLLAAWRRRPLLAMLSATLAGYTLTMTFHVIRWNFPAARAGFVKLDEMIVVGIASVVAAVSLLNFRRPEISPVRAVTASFLLLFAAFAAYAFSTSSAGRGSTWIAMLGPMFATVLHIPFARGWDTKTGTHPNQRPRPDSSTTL